MNGFVMPRVIRNISRAEENEGGTIHNRTNLNMENGIYVDEEYDCDMGEEEEIGEDTTTTVWEDVQIEFVPPPEKSEAGLMGRGVPITSNSIPHLVGVDTDEPLFPDSAHSAKDFARYILAMRYTLGKLIYNWTLAVTYIHSLYYICNDRLGRRCVRDMCRFHSLISPINAFLSTVFNEEAKCVPHFADYASRQWSSK